MTLYIKYATFAINLPLGYENGNADYRLILSFRSFFFVTCRGLIFAVLMYRKHSSEIAIIDSMIHLSLLLSSVLPILFTSCGHHVAGIILS